MTSNKRAKPLEGRLKPVTGPIKSSLYESVSRRDQNLRYRIESLVAVAAVRVAMWTPCVAVYIDLQREAEVGLALKELPGETCALERLGLLQKFEAFG